MERFIQLHILTHYPPSNPNRDDLGQPKSALVGGAKRQRISSQALKRAVRESDVFADALKGHQGERTQRLGRLVFEHVVAKGADEAKATEIAREVAGAFGKIKSDKAEKLEDRLEIEQLAFISPSEKTLALELAERLLAGEALPKEKELAKLALLPSDGAVDIAMFGRMLASHPEFNREAAVQVSHAITTNKVDGENDYYTAVDDLKTLAEDAGAGFVGEAGFGSGVYYIHVCINADLLLKNLGGDAALAARGVEALVKAVATATPSGKKNSFSNHVRADYVLCERGDGQPLNLFSAFATPVSGTRLCEESVARLVACRDAFGKAYGPWWSIEPKWLHVHGEDGVSLDDLARYAAAGLAA